MKKKLFIISILFLGFTIPSIAQQKTITGKVMNASSGNAIIGATVTVEGSVEATQTGPDGNFSIIAPSTAQALIFTFVGFETQTIPIKNQKEINVVLQVSNSQLSEVVVIGYGTQKRSDLTGAIATVKGNELTQVATSDPVQALQGKVAGVQITSNSGRPGSGTRIRIRGIGTINNSDPLYVVDGFQTSDISFLMPGDIASIEILKDASATAIYGSRGANGVVLVTTNKGKVGKAQVSFDGYTGFQELWHKLKVTDAAGYATLVSEAYKNLSQPVPSNFQDAFQQTLQNNKKGTDWQNVVTQKGLIANYHLTISGGSEKDRYLVSGDYFQQDGTVKNTGLQKYVLRFNNDYNFSKDIKAGVSVNFTNAINFGNQNLLRNAVLANPLIAAFTPTGGYGYDSLSNGVNIARQINEQKLNKTISTDLYANFFIEATIFKGFSYRSNFGIRYDNYHNKTYLAQYYIGINDQNSISSLGENRSQTVNWVWTNYINYNTILGSSNNISVTLGQEAQRNQSNGINLRAFDVPSDVSLQYISATRSVSISNFGSSQYDNSLLSFFGRANYAYKSRYLLTATLRYDGSSKFLPSVQWGVFPSLGAAWRISDENFFTNNIKFISSLKLRAGWGKVGNQSAAPNYAFITTANPNMNYVFNDAVVPGLMPTQLSNPNLKWESAITDNIGLDAGFFDEKLTFTADYFIKKTKDMIALLPVADYIGAGPASANVASMENKGLEFSVNYKNQVGKFRYNIGANFSKIRNEVTDLGGASPLASGNVIIQMGNTTLTDIRHEIAYFYGLKTNGIFHSQNEVDSYRNKDGQLIQPNAQPGDVKFVDGNGDGKINNQDRAYLGSASNPDLTYGLTLSLEYNNFDFRVLLYGVQGVKAINGLSYYLLKTTTNTGSWNNFYSSRLDRWSPDNPTTNQPRIVAKDLNRNDQFSDRFVEDASYLRFRNVELGYTLPQKVLSKYHINSIRLSLSVDNLFTITKYTGFDPEISSDGFYGDPLAYGVDFGNYPQPRTYRLALSLQF